jgi:hypothetical protein
VIAWIWTFKKCHRRVHVLSSKINVMVRVLLRTGEAENKTVAGFRFLRLVKKPCAVRFSEVSPHPVTKEKTMEIVFDKIYDGFEDAADLERDISEMWEEAPQEIEAEWQGKLRVLITYESPVLDGRTCGGCKNEAQEDHECPFKSEIRHSDELCNCCDECTEQCMMNI